MRTFPLHGIRWLVVVLPLGLIVACGARPVDTEAPPDPAIARAPEATSGPPAPMPRNPAPKTRSRPTPAENGPRQVPAEPLVRAAGRVEPNTTLGVLVYDRVTGQTPLAHNADRAFRSASLVKLLITIDALEHGADARDRQRIARMLRNSDDGLASAFWVSAGGLEMVARTSARLGLAGVRPPEDPSQWGEVVLTPRDVAAIYRHVLKLPGPDRALIVTALAGAPRFAADGFDQHFGIPDGIQGEWAVKQGWGNNGSAMVLHSTGLVGPDLRYVAVLLTEHPLGTGWQNSAKAVTAAAASMHGLLPGV